MDIEKEQIIQDGYIDQIGIVVNDIGKVISSIQELLGIGPFSVFNWPKDDGDCKAEYYGKPGNWKMKLAFANIGQMKLELIQPVSGESIFMDFLRDNGPGLHHLRCIVPDIEKNLTAVKKMGLQIISRGQGVHEGSTWAYIDTRDLMDGVLIELRNQLD